MLSPQGSSEPLRSGSSSPGARVLAVDLGAASVRVVAVDLAASPPAMTELHRVAHGPVRHADGTLRWDWARLTAEVEHGLRKGLAQGPVASIGIDTWGVDYALLDRTGALVAPPFSYRDNRTGSWMEVVEQVGADQLYRCTGIQLMPINTVFQLAAHDRWELECAEQILLLPELLVHHLTGEAHGERTSAGTTSLVDLATGTWSATLLEAVGVDPQLLPQIRPATTPAGRWRGVPVHIVGGHDTASAVAAVPGPPPPDAVFVSSGTWLLVGVERPAPDVSDAARLGNFSNEPGVLGGIRFLKNVMGFWMLEECRRAWGTPPVEALTAAAALVPSRAAVVDARDQRFLTPVDMEAEVRTAARLPASATRADVARCILDSLAQSTAAVIREIEAVLGRAVPEIAVVGGGSKNSLLNQLTEEAAGVPVRAGAVEATALGNAVVQGIALGVYADLDHARRALAEPA